MIKSELWPAIADDHWVERLIPAIQQAITATAPSISRDDAGHVLAAPDVANALVIVLASVLASSPTCATPSGMRKLGEAAGRESHRLIRDARQLQAGEAETMQTRQ